MPFVSLSPGDFSLCLHIAAQRTIDSLLNDRTDTLHPKTYEHHHATHLKGAIGEVAFAKWRDSYPRPTVREFRGMESDASGGVEVRYRSDPTWDLKVHDYDEDNRIYVLVRGVPPAPIEIAGWLWGYEAKKEKWVVDHGSYGKPAYFIPAEELRSAEEMP